VAKVVLEDKEAKEVMEEIAILGPSIIMMSEKIDTMKEVGMVIMDNPDNLVIVVEMDKMDRMEA
jgi:hypothetical protein